MTALRVRQVVAAVRDVDATADLAVAAGLPFVYIDEGVGYFGARNSLHRIGDSFLELLGEKDAGSPVGRHLDRLGGDGGYMVIVQVDDLDAHLARIEKLGVRVIWTGGHSGIRGAHLHPADVGGAILSLDEVDPPEAWPWCGPEWTGGAGEHAGDPIGAIEVTSADPAATAARWGDILDVPVERTRVRLERTTIEFVPADDRPARLVDVTAPGVEAVEIGGLRIHG